MPDNLEAAMDRAELFASHHAKSRKTKNFDELSMISGNSTNGNGTYECPVCGKTFSTKFALNRHMEKMHPNKRIKRQVQDKSGQVQIKKFKTLSCQEKLAQQSFDGISLYFSNSLFRLFIRSSFTAATQLSWLGPYIQLSYEAFRNTEKTLYRPANWLTSNHERKTSPGWRQYT